MPSGFHNVRFPALSSNSYGQTENCYYCSVAALLNTTTSNLVGVTGTMMQDTAKPDEIIDLFRDAGVHARYDWTFDPAAMHGILLTLPAGHGVGLAYTRSNGSGHMVVAIRDEGWVSGMGGIKIVDYQARPPTVSGFPPENGQNVTTYYVFYQW